MKTKIAAVGKSVKQSPAVREDTVVAKKKREHDLHNAILRPWFHNGGKIHELKISAANRLLEFVTISGQSDEVFEKRAMLGKHGTQSLSDLRKHPEKLNTRTITSILAATRHTVVELFVEQLGPGHEEQIAAGLSHLIAGMQESMGLTTDSGSFEKSFRDRPQAEQIQDIATAFLRAFDCDNQRREESVQNAK